MITNVSCRQTSMCSCTFYTTIHKNIFNGVFSLSENECGNVTVGGKVDIEIIEMWVHYACTYICIDMNDETISYNDKLM